jgi:hypothetical protein
MERILNLIFKNPFLLVFLCTSASPREILSFQFPVKKTVPPQRRRELREKKLEFLYYLFFVVIKLAVK